MKKTYAGLIGLTVCLLPPPLMAQLADFQSVSEGILTTVSKHGRTVHEITGSAATDLERGPARAEGETFNVTLKYTDNGEDVLGSFSYAFLQPGADGTTARTKGTINKADGTVVFDIPGGTYDFGVDFSRGAANYDVFLGLEGIVVDKDTVINMYPDECQHLVTCAPTMPNGEPLEPRLLDYTNNNEVVEWGNFPFGYCVATMAYQVGAQTTATHTIEMARQYFGDGVTVDLWERYGCRYINDVKHFRPIFLLCGNTWPGGSVSMFLTVPENFGESITTQFIQNNVSDFASFECNFPEYELEPYFTGQYDQTLVNNTYAVLLRGDVGMIRYGSVAGGRAPMFSQSPVQLLLPTAGPEWCRSLQLVPEVSKIYQKDTPAGIYAGVFLSPLQEPVSQSVPVFSTSAPNSFLLKTPLIGAYLNNVPGGETDWSVNPTFSFNPMDYDKIDLCNNAPVTLVAFSGNKSDFVPVGMYGEFRTIDLVHNSSVTAMYRDSLVSTSYNDIFTVQNDIWKTANPKGPWTVVFNNNNFTVDGMAGHNNTVFHFDTSLTGMERQSPSLRILQLRNSENLITNKAADASELTMLFAANKYAYTAVKTMDMMAPTGIKVEYAPHGNGEFAELEWTAEPELYFEPGIGNVYKVDMSQVTRKSQTGWFDLRVTLTDDYGNYQTQEFGPVFKIESLSGVEDIREDENVWVEGNSIVAPAGAEIYTLDGRRVSSRGLPSGVYAVRCNGKGIKVAVK